MFGCCVAGRLIQTSLQQVDETHAYFELPSASSINHVCVFLLGTVPFPDGYGATVHFFWPGKGFQLLGMLSNDKPSAIFRLRGTFTSTSTSSNAQSAFSQPTQQGVAAGDVTAVLGISIEPLSSIQSQIAPLSNTGTNPANANGLSTSSAVVKPPDATLLAERIVKHLFNYLSGFTGGATGDVAVPMSAFVKWYEIFVGKVRAGGTGFLERVD